MNNRTIFFLIFGLVLIIWWQPFNFGKGEIYIPKGSSGFQIASILSITHILRSREEFLFCLRILGKEKDLKFGRYELPRFSNPLYLIHKLTTGRKLEIIVTIPEGLTIYETAELLEINNVIKKNRFIKLCHDRRFVHYLGIKGLSLEGYLFPDTYSFNETQCDTAIIKTFIENFRKRISKFGLIDTNLLYKILIISSIVEKEAKYDEERPIIAEVFLNRLKLDRPLESCATVIYVLEGKSQVEYQSGNLHKTRLTEKDLKIESPYNTYLYTGLPPGPICSPGIKSIDAVFSPTDSNYLYFVSKGDGWHYFSKTFKEHQAAKERYREAK